MKVMSINTGVSSLKFSLFDMKDFSLIIKGSFERIGIEGGTYTLKFNNNKIRIEADLPDFLTVVKILLEKLIELEAIESINDIVGVGHRIVHGGDKYSQSVVITDEVINDIISFSDYAPLHNPSHAICIKAFQKVLPNIKMVAVFDTAFHQSISKDRYLYAVPYEWYEKYHVRKYGAHGTSHRYVALELARLTGMKSMNIISCHLGNSSSICAIEDGKSRDISMGFNPNSGLMMGTRSGDIDVSFIPYVMEKERKDADEILEDLNKKSGFLGISGISSDTRDLEKGYIQGDERCKNALKMYVNQVVKYIATYYVLLGRVDALVFTSGIGENSPLIRELVVDELGALGIKIDKQKNRVKGKYSKISTKDSKVNVFILPTNEDLLIAKDTIELIGGINNA